MKLRVRLIYRFSFLTEKLEKLVSASFSICTVRSLLGQNKPVISYRVLLGLSGLAPRSNSRSPKEVALIATDC
jgi:hypothetical protein